MQDKGYAKIRFVTTNCEYEAQVHVMANFGEQVIGSYLMYSHIIPV